MTTVSDLPWELREEILSRVSLTSLSAVRSTCKNWNALTKNQILGKLATVVKRQFLGFMLMDFRICSLRFDLQGIGKDNDDYVDHQSIKQVSKFSQVEICEVFHCDGLLLCVIKDEDNPRLVAWNPYLGQTRWIKPRNKFHTFDMCAIGYDDSNNRSHKVLRFLDGDNGKDFYFWFEIYEFNSNSWRILDVSPDWDIMYYHRVSLKGNAYFVAREKPKKKRAVFLLCFDFTTETFGQRLPLPFPSCVFPYETATLSCVRDDQLAVLYHSRYDEFMEIWITSKVEPNDVSWTKFLRVDKRWLTGFSAPFSAGSFFIDEEKKVAVFSYLRKFKPAKTTCRHQIACIIGEDGYFKSLNIGEAREPDEYGDYHPHVFSSYVPSLVHIGKEELIN